MHSAFVDPRHTWGYVGERLLRQVVVVSVPFHARDVGVEDLIRHMDVVVCVRCRSGGIHSYATHA